MICYSPLYSDTSTEKVKYNQEENFNFVTGNLI